MLKRATPLPSSVGDLYIRRRPSDKRYVFVSHGKALSHTDHERLLRVMAKIWCQGAKDGHYAGMVSINDVSRMWTRAGITKTGLQPILALQTPRGRRVWCLFPRLLALFPLYAWLTEAGSRVVCCLCHVG